MQIYDEQQTLMLPWGALCDLCGGSSQILTPGPKPVNYKPCPGDPSRGFKCVAGLSSNLYQRSVSPYFEEVGTGYRPVWARAGYSREAYLRAEEFHRLAAEKRKVEEAKKAKEPKLETEFVMKTQEVKKMTRLGAIYWKIINAIEYPFRAIGRQYKRWFGVQGSARQWIEKKIGTEVKYKTNHATYSSERIVTNKYLKEVRTFWHRHVQYGNHSINGDPWYTVQYRSKKFMVDLTSRKNVGWDVHLWVLDKRGMCKEHRPLIWRIRKGKEDFWPAPTFDTFDFEHHELAMQADYYREMRGWSFYPSRATGRVIN